MEEKKDEKEDDGRGDGRGDGSREVVSSPDPTLSRGETVW